MMASVARSFGVGFLTLGGLGLVVPWVNALIATAGRRDAKAAPAMAESPAEKDV